ncbi:MAG: DUF2809 domain-containing protein [Oscillospiraceae bacterium]|nr:DUF2809 domain-containing protein [Oscillospiraceae bacterium]
MSVRAVRLSAAAGALLLLGIEILIGMYAHGWVRIYLGDVLVVILLYALWRAVFPRRPAYGVLLPAAILLFAFCVEFLQLWGFADKMHITNRLLRIIIGTGFSVIDLLSYAVGILPCMLFELLYHKAQKKTT